MNRFSITLLLGACATLSSCGTIKNVGSGGKWAYEKAGEGVGTATRAVVSTTKKLVTWDWGKKDAAPTAQSGTEAAPAAPPATAAPKLFEFPDHNLLVTDTMLGDKRQASPDGRASFANGWSVEADKIFYTSAFASDPPTLLRAEGSPAKAQALIEGDAVTAEGRQIHWQEQTGILVIKGSPKFQVGQKRVTGGPNSSIRLHLPTKAMSADGSIRTEHISP